jgi:hypothetical protein
MDMAIHEFIAKSFGDHILSSESVSEDQRQKIIESMMAFVYAHRHNKDDRFIIEAKSRGFIDFSIVRDVMYKYSKRAQDRFFENAIESYFFAKFAK